MTPEPTRSRIEEVMAGILIGSQASWFVPFLVEIHESVDGTTGILHVLRRNLV